MNEGMQRDESVYACILYS